MPPGGGSSATRWSKPLGELGPRGERRPRDDRHRAAGERRHDGLEAGAAARHVRHRDQHGLAAREEVAGHTGEALAAPVLDDACGSGTQRRAEPPARRAARSSVPEGVVLAEHVDLARLGRAERAQDHARLHDPLPAVLLQPEGDVVGSLGRRGERLGRRAERHAARLRAAGCHEREAGVLLLLAHAGHALEAGGGHEQGRLRVAHPERAEQLEVLGEVEAEVAAGHDGVDALDRDQVVRGQRRAGVRGERAPERHRRSRLPVPLPRPSCDRRSGPGAPSTRPARRGGRRRRCCGRSRGRRPGSSSAITTQGGASVPPAGTPRFPRPRGASPPPPPRSRPGAPAARSGLGGEQDAGLRLLAVAVQEVELPGHLARRGRRLR